MDCTRAAIHEHLSTNNYQGRKWDFDEIIDIADKRLGKNSVLVVSGFANQRLRTDGRYELLVRKPSKK